MRKTAQHAQPHTGASATARDTSLAVPTLLAAALRERQLNVDLAQPWDCPHSGDYDLDELFAWIEARV